MPSFAPVNAETLQESLFVSMVKDKTIKEQLISQELPSHFKVLLPGKFKATNAHWKQGPFLRFAPWIIPV